MNKDLIERCMKTGKDLDKDAFENLFKDETSSLLNKFVLLKSLNKEKNNELDMLATVIGGILAVGTNNIDEAISSLGEVYKKTRVLFCEADAIINKED